MNALNSIWEASDTNFVRSLIVTRILSIALMIAAFVLYILALARYSIGGMNLPNIVILLTIVALLGYPRYRAQLRRFLPHLWMGIPFTLYVITIVVPVYVIASFPPGRAFEERLTLPPASAQETQAYRQFTILTNEARADPQLQRELILAFLERNVVSVPESALSPDAAFPLYGLLVREGREGILNGISRMVNAGDRSGAKEKYTQLWRVSESLVSDRGTLIQHLVGVAIAESLADLSLEDDKILGLAEDDEILDLAGGTQWVKAPTATPPPPV